MDQENIDWEYDCPQFISFSGSFNDDDEAEKYFEIDHENLPKRRMKSSPNDSKNGFSESEYHTPESAKSEKCLGDSSQELSENEITLQISSHENKIRTVNKDNSVERSPQKNAAYNLRSTSARVKNLQDLVTSTPTNAVPESLFHSKRKLLSAIKFSHSSKKKNCHSPEPSSKIKKLVVPSTPECIKKPELRFNSLRKAASAIGKKKRSLFEKLSRPKRQPLPVMEHKPLKPFPLKKTVLNPFNFATDKRFKDQNSKPEVKVKDFVASLRSNTPSKQKPHERTTQVVPFKLTEIRKRKYSEESQAYQSLAEQVASHNLHFREAKKSDLSSLQLSGAKRRKTNVVPLTPKLNALTRNRPLTVLSQQQQEDLEVERMKSYKFKATAINPELFTHKFEVKHENTKLPKSQNMNLETEKRFNKESKAKVEEEKYEFHARPVPVEILNGLVGVKKVTPKPTTHAASPQFALKERASKWKVTDIKENKENQSLPIMKPNHKRKHNGVSVEVVKPKFQVTKTIPKPFSFYEKDQQRLASKELKISEIIKEEKKMHDFYANPMPTNTPSNLPKKKLKLATVVHPFNLTSHHRLETNESTNNESTESSIFHFKAHPASIVHKAPFLPKRNNKKPTEIKEFKLHSQLRASDREKYDEYLKHKAHEAEKQNKARQEMEEQQEKQYIAQLRAQMVHKANPVRNFKRVDIKKSDKELTAAHSPLLLTKSRTKPFELHF